VFGAVDGLVTNASLISGLGGGASAHTVVLTGVAALVAGAFSMGTGEYISVTNQNELMHSEVALESQMSSLPRSWAGAASLIAFSLGALVPLLPYLLGLPHLAATLVITAQPW
jgi:VIT1/CCC1 family predicted Fe2+/Mn2+ transporter